MKTKALKIIVLILVCLSGLYFSKAEEVSKEEYKLQMKNISSGVKYEDYELKSPYVYYIKDGVEYPAYCLNKDLAGVEGYIGGDYIVTPKEIITDTDLWRLFTNGYPYKSYEKMGCKTKEEAFSATIEALRFIMYHYDISKYEAINESGQRVFSAMINLINVARNGKDVMKSSVLTISPITTKWQIDSKNNSYAYQEYVVDNSEIEGKYTIEFRSIPPIGSMITDMDSNPKSEFTSGEHFKVLIPIEKMKVEDSFIILASADIKSMPIFNAFAQQTNLQNYALTHGMYERARGQILIDYKDCQSNITIIKKDEETEERLQNAVFNLLDENKKTIHINLVTDKEGKININNIMPGIYYLEETNPPIGYRKINELIKIELKLNQNLTVNINNCKAKEMETSNSTGVINVTTKYEENITNSDKYEENIELNEKTDKSINNKEIKNETNTNINQTESKSKIEESVTNTQIQTDTNQNNQVKEESNTSTKQTENITNRKDEIKNSIEDKQKSVNSLSSKILPKTGM